MYLTNAHLCRRGSHASKRASARSLAAKLERPNQASGLHSARRPRSLALVEGSAIGTLERHCRRLCVTNRPRQPASRRPGAINLGAARPNEVSESGRRCEVMIGEGRAWLAGVYPNDCAKSNCRERELVCARREVPLARPLANSLACRPASWPDRNPESTLGSCLRLIVFVNRARIRVQSSGWRASECGCAPGCPCRAEGGRQFFRKHCNQSTKQRRGRACSVSGCRRELSTRSLRLGRRQRRRRLCACN